MSRAAALSQEVFFQPDSLSVELVCDYPSFLQLKSGWDRLVEESGIDHPFLTHDWMDAWWQCFGQGKDLYVLVARHGDRMVGIAPLMRSRQSMCGWRLRCLKSLGNVHTPRFDFICAPPAGGVVEALWRFLSSGASSWDLLQLCQLPAHSPALVTLSRLAPKSGFLTGLWDSGASPYIPLQGNWKDYFSGLNGKHRSNLRNRLKRLHRSGNVQLEVVTSLQGLEESLEEGLHIEAAAWKKSAGTAIVCRPAVRRFYSELARRAARQGWLRLQFLKVNQRRVAFHYCLNYRHKLYLLKPGYDPEYACYSPSNLLCHLVLQEAFDQGLKEYDFLGLAEDWKLQWSRETRPHRWLFVFPRRRCSQLLHALKFRVLPWVKTRCTHQHGQV